MELLFPFSFLAVFDGFSVGAQANPTVSTVATSHHRIYHYPARSAARTRCLPIDGQLVSPP
ncbi:MAG: hypothetical protein WC400_02995 [Patescibacteria group bacterium]